MRQFGFPNFLPGTPTRLTGELPIENFWEMIVPKNQLWLFMSFRCRYSASASANVRYLRMEFFELIESSNYKSILRIMSEFPHLASESFNYNIVAGGQDQPQSSHGGEIKLKAPPGLWLKEDDKIKVDMVNFNTADAFSQTLLNIYKVLIPDQV